MVNDWIAGPTQSQFTVPTNLPYYSTIEKWDTSLITIMSNLFLNQTTFNDDIGNWVTSIVTDISNMFIGATSFNQYNGGWDTSILRTTQPQPGCAYMFRNTTAFIQDIRVWNVRTTGAYTPADTMSSMFHGATLMLAFYSTDSAGNQIIVNASPGSTIF